MLTGRDQDSQAVSQFGVRMLASTHFEVTDGEVRPENACSSLPSLVDFAYLYIPQALHTADAAFFPPKETFIDRISLIFKYNDKTCKFGPQQRGTARKTAVTQPGDSPKTRKCPVWSDWGRV